MPWNLNINFVTRHKLWISRTGEREGWVWFRCSTHMHSMYISILYHTRICMVSQVHYIYTYMYVAVPSLDYYTNKVTDKHIWSKESHYYTPRNDPVGWKTYVGKCWNRKHSQHASISSTNIMSNLNLLQSFIYAHTLEKFYGSSKCNKYFGQRSTILNSS